MAPLSRTVQATSVFDVVSLPMLAGAILTNVLAIIKYLGGVESIELWVVFAPIFVAILLVAFLEGLPFALGLVNQYGREVKPQPVPVAINFGALKLEASNPNKFLAQVANVLSTGLVLGICKLLYPEQLEWYYVVLPVLVWFFARMIALYVGVGIFALLVKFHNKRVAETL